MSVRIPESGKTMVEVTFRTLEIKGGIGTEAEIGILA
jgi:hypothetical protein